MGLLAGFLAVTTHAGDLLRGGATAGKSNGAAAPQPGAAAAAAAKANAADILARTTQALQSVQNLQQAANGLGQGANNAGLNPQGGGMLPNVPDGLAPGGLQVAPGATPGSSLWQGANLPVQVPGQSAGTTTISITQQAPTAILTWQTFNVGRHTLLQFDQDLGGGETSQWIAFNIVNDPSGVPSQILGSIQANGQVFVVNRNGIIFGGASQVNTHALFASSLPINDSLVTSGLLVNPTAQFLFSSGTFSTSGFSAPATEPGDVIVEAGASLTAPTSAAHVGGRVVLVGPNVTNNGTITTPDGQTILAAGEQVGFQAHPTADATLRGLDAYIGAVDPGTGTATNNGIIEAPRADTMITGATVIQNGVIDSSTSVTLNGRVDLLANFGATTYTNTATSVTSLVPTLTGAVIFGPGSVTQILPEWSSTETNVGTVLPLPSQVIVEGRSIHMESDAILLAPGATPPSTPAEDLVGAAQTSGVTFNAGSWFMPSSTTQPVFLNTSGQILLDAGATINVTGSTNVSVPTSQNILSVTLLGNELANSPTQREAIRGITIQVDLRNTGSYNGQYWVGTPLANLYGYVGLIEKGVGQLSVNGGTVSLSAGGSVIMQPGSNVNVSGGYLNYTGGMVQTTRLLTTSGYVEDISQATPDQSYLGIYTGRFTTRYAAWGVADQFSNPLALTGAHDEAPYVQGGNGGTISITAPTMALDGTLLGNVVTGPRQLRTTSTTFASTSSDTSSTSTSSTPPALSSLNLTFLAVDQTILPTILNDFPATTPATAPPNVLFQNGVTLPPANPANVDPTYNVLLGQRGATVVLSPALLTQNGFGNLNVNNRDGNITVPANVALNAPPGGSIALSGVNIDVAGKVSAPGGSLSFNVYDFSALTVYNDKLASITPSVDPTRGNFVLAAGATLSTAGLVVDDREASPTALTQLLTLNGGSITINSFNTALFPGSVIDVSGGVAISPTGARTYGSGGSITITSGRDLSIGTVLGGVLELGSELEGYSSGGGSSSLGAISGGGNGGSLNIQATLIQIGGMPSVSNALWLSPQFFDQGGFASFTLTGLGEFGPNGEYLNAIDIAPGTVVAPAAQARVASTSGPGVSWETVNEPLGNRTPVSLTFDAPGIVDGNLNAQINNNPIARTRGDFVLGAGAVIQTYPTGSVTINSQTATILGSIIAPGGSISINTNPIEESFGDETLSPNGALLTPFGTNVPSLDLGPHSVLSTAGTVVLVPNAYGYRVGSVLPGGSVSLSGNIVAEAGSVIDVSGTSGVLDLAPATIGESAPLLGALSGQPAIPQTRISKPTFNGFLDPSLPNGATATTSTASNPGTGSFSGTATTPVLVSSNGGSISMTGVAELFTDATLRGAAGGPTATGGTLSITSVSVSVTQSGPTIPVASFYNPASAAALGVAPAQASNGQTAIGQPVLGTNGLPILGSFFAANNFLTSGFDNLALNGSITFNGPVSIAARASITVANGGSVTANSTVNLSAPYVDLGAAFVPPGIANSFATAPTYGPGSFSVTAQYIDVGNVAMENIGQTALTAINGDIRGDGTLAASGSIILQAGQIYPATGVNFTIAVSDYAVGGVNQLGSVTILPGGVRQLPLSAAGSLDITGSIINQGGTLRAPLGSISIGTATTTQVNLLPGSVTSVSAIDPLSGQGVIIPYGINVNGTSWIDPTGTDITADLVPQKSITVSALNVNAQAGSTIDVRGGGDLLAYQFVSGTGGTNDILSWNYEGGWSSTQSYQATQVVSYKGSYYYATVTDPSGPPAVGPDWNKVVPSYAVIPGYQPASTPYAPNNIPSLYGFNDPSGISPNLGADQGYTNPTLGIGSSIYLSGVSGLKAGVYTLLPARYALLPGAFLVTPQSTTSIGTYNLTDNSSIVTGYTLNSLDQSAAHPGLYTTVDVADSKVINERALYTVYQANEFLATQSQILGLEIPRLPTDAGSLVIAGTNGLSLSGTVQGQGADGGRGADIDLSTDANIVIGGPGGSAPPGDVFLNASLLSSFGAESLLIGGTRQIGSSAVTITVNTPNITVENAGAPLVGPEIILAANDGITLDPGAAIIQTGSIPQGGLYPYLPILIGNSAMAGSGDGVLLRVGATSTTVERSGVDSSTTPNIAIGAGAFVSGENVAIDSTAGGSIDPTAVIRGQNVSVSAGTINILLNQADTPVISGINLGGTALNSLLGTSALSLTGYNSIDIYGPGTITSGNLGFHTGSLRGFADSSSDVVTINATSLTLDNAGGQSGLAPNPGTPIQGTLMVNAGTLYTGANTTNIDQYASVNLAVSNGMVLQNSGAISSQTNLTITTPIIVGAAQASQTITAQSGALMILTPAAGGTGTNLSSSAGLGTTLNLLGQGVTENSRIYLPSGQLNITDTAPTAAAGGISVGGTLDVSGTAMRFYDTIQYTPGGNITLSSLNGSINLASGSTVSVAANPGGGNAGNVSISAPNGTFTLSGTLSGSGGAGGTNGSFSADFSPNYNGTTPNFDISSIDGVLNNGGFTQSRTYRVRTGNAYLEGTTDGLAEAFNYSLSVDGGSIEVQSGGGVDASLKGTSITGGTISLIANGGVTLDGGATLTVAALNFSDAGQGGSVTLEAGSAVNGVPNLSGAVNIASTSTIDLSVAALNGPNSPIAGLTTAQIANVLGISTAQAAALTPTQVAGDVYGLFTGTLHIRSPQNAAGTGFAINPTLDGTIKDPSSIVVEGYQIYNLTGTGGQITNSGTNVTPSGSNGVVQFVSTGQNVEGSVFANGTTFGNGTAGLYSTLLANNPDVVANNANGAQLTAALSIVPGAELINTATAAPLTFTLNTSGSSSLVAGLMSNGTGAAFYFPNGTPGNDQIKSTVAGTITLPSGAISTLAANTATPITTGSTVTLSGTGTLSFASGGTGGAITVDVQPGESVTTGTSGTTTATVNSVGDAITLNTAGTSSVTIPAGATSTTVLLPAGTTGTSKIQSSVNATVTSATGVVTTLVANTPQAITAGSTITMPLGGGTLKYSSGGNTAIALTLESGSFTTSGTVAATPVTGNLTLGSTTSTSTSDWDLSSYRFGPDSVPGVLTLRAAGNLVFYNSLSDGFSGAAASAAGEPLYTAPLMAYNPLLPADAQSYSYTLTAGADFAGANSRAVRPLTTLQSTGTGSLILGKTVGAGTTAAGTAAGGVLTVTGGSNALTSSAANAYGQMIRTGSGSISISAGNNVLLMNNLASIYTAGTQVADPTALTDGVLQLPILFNTNHLLSSASTTFFGTAQEPFRTTTYQGNPQYSLGGGNIIVDAQGTIEHVNVIAGALVADSSKEMPTNWLERRDIVTDGQFIASPNGDLGSTTWWVDFSNFFEGVGALGGGNVTLQAGGDIDNVDAVVPTNARAPGFTDATMNTQVAPNPNNLTVLGGGDVTVTAGDNINAGVYYVESGTGTLTAGNSIITNATRDISQQNVGNSNPKPFVPTTTSLSWLPTTLFLGGNARNGPGGFTVSATNSVTLGPVANAFLLPESINNLTGYRTYFSTYAAADYVNVSSLSGSVTLAEDFTSPVYGSITPFLQAWYQSVLGVSNTGSGLATTNIAFYQPWLRVNETFSLQSVLNTNFETAPAILPPSLSVTAFSGNINLQGNLTLMPSPTGTLNLLADGAINGLQSTGTVTGAAAINVSDANPASVNGVATPLAVPFSTAVVASVFVKSSPNFGLLNEEFAESGQSSGTGTSPMNNVFVDYGSPVIQQALNDSAVLHTGDPNPVRIYTLDGDIANLTLFSSKEAQVLAGLDITNDSFYIQNVSSQNITVISAGRDITPYDPDPALNIQEGIGSNPTGDIQINGPGTLEVLAGRNLDLGAVLSSNSAIESQYAIDGLGLGITSVGNARNPALTFTGANIITAAGIGGPGDLSSNPNLNYSEFGTQYLNGGSNGSNYLSELGVNTTDISSLSPEQQAVIATDVFFLILRDAGRAHTAGTGSYSSGFSAISKLFGNANSEMGDVSLTSREIATTNGGEIDVLAPNGQVVVGFDVIGQALSQGIITQDGGNINIFANGNVTLGTSRIFTLRGGNIIIWSSAGSIAAGSAAKTVTAAPPTQVLVDAASADVKTDLAGLATGGGIGVLATVAGVPPGNVDLIAPVGVVDAGDAGIRATGNLNIAATKVLNASNIQVSGSSTGVPVAAVVAIPNIGGLSSASAAAAAGSQSANEVTKSAAPTPPPVLETDSRISVEVVGYGGGEGSSGASPQ